MMTWYISDAFDNGTVSSIEIINEMKVNDSLFFY